MKLSTEQLDAVYWLIHDELNSKSRVSRREIELGNKKREQEAVDKFKKTKEYEAIMLLAKTFPRTNIDWSKKDRINSISQQMFKPKRISPFIHLRDARKDIALMSIDCKNLAELKDKINKHYNLKKSLK